MKTLRDELKQAGQETWQIIGGDILRASSEVAGEDNISRDDVIDVVIDHLSNQPPWEELSDAAHALWEGMSFSDMQKLLKETFTYERYGW